MATMVKPLDAEGPSALPGVLLSNASVTLIKCQGRSEHLVAMASSAEQLPNLSNVHSLDKALVERVCNDDPSAIQELLKVRCGPVIRYLSKQFRYDDLENELYVRLKENTWCRLRTWTGRSSLPVWIKQVAFHLCLEQTRPRRPTESLEKLGESVMMDSIEGHRGYEAGIRRLDLLKAIRTLEPREQFLITQQVLHDRSIKEVAAQLGITREYADVIRHRAIGRLRDKLVSKGGQA